MAATLEYATPALAPPRARLRRWCGLVGLGAAVLAGILGWFHPAAFFQAYLFAALAGLSPAMGCLLLVFIHRMAGGTWGHTLAPALTAGCRMVPWALLFCLPLFFGLDHLFPWAMPGALDAQSRALLAKHGAYFSRPAFIGRAFGYVVLCFGLLWLARRRQTGWTGPVGMMVYVLTAYLLGVDWVMSLEPGWYSTGFPVIFMAGQALSALAFCIAATILARGPGEADTKNHAVWRDLGNLLLGAVMFWAYVAYSQFLVVWSGNLPAQASWYLHRNAGGWHDLLVVLAVLQLFVPVLLLLSHRTKRPTRFFAALAFGVLLGQVVYLYWLILPTFRPSGIAFEPLDAVLPLAVDALWLYCFLGVASAAKEAADV
jgi:hypothetical protein